MKTAKLLIADSESNSDMYWATRLFVPDPFIFLQWGEHTAIVVSDLELARARHEAQVDQVLSYSEYVVKCRGRHDRPVREGEVIVKILKERGIRRVTVPSYFPFEKARKLEGLGLKVETKPDPFFDERAIKTRDEKEAIRHTLACVSKSLRAAVGLLKKSRIRGNRILSKGRPLYCNDLRETIDSTLYTLGCLARHSITSCGPDSADPHAEGTGPVLPNAPIVLDIFPKDIKSGYFGDMTRTVVKGKAPAPLKNMYRAVLAAQEVGIQSIRAGVSGDKVHRAVERELEHHGFKTECKNGTPQGFIHSTGHGLGLDVHEAPRVSRGAGRLKAGVVVSVEPGLYYRDIGGVRIEDIVYVTKRGCEILSHFPKKLELP